jgi:putative transposase
MITSILLEIFLYLLPPYSPELNQIEPGFCQVKHQEIIQRSHTTRVGLSGAVEVGFTNYARKLRSKSPRELRPVA